MTDDAIGKIREAEKRAEEIRAAANVKAAEMTADAERRGEALLEKTETEVRAEINRMFSELKEKSDKLIEKSRADATAECDELRRAARLRMRNAANEIVRGIGKQCQ